MPHSDRLGSSPSCLLRARCNEPNDSSEKSMSSTWIPSRHRRRDPIQPGSSRLYVQTRKLNTSWSGRREGAWRWCGRRTWNRRVSGRDGEDGGAVAVNDRARPAPARMRRGARDLDRIESKVLVDAIARRAENVAEIASTVPRERRRDAPDIDWNRVAACEIGRWLDDDPLDESLRQLVEDELPCRKDITDRPSAMRPEDSGSRPDGRLAGRPSPGPVVAMPISRPHRCTRKRLAHPGDQSRPGSRRRSKGRCRPPDRSRST